MSPKQIFNGGSAPAWISAAVAVLMAIAALVAWANSPTAARLADHEQRLRVIEETVTRELAEIKTELRSMRREMERDP